MNDTEKSYHFTDVLDALNTLIQERGKNVTSLLIGISMYHLNKMLRYEHPADRLTLKYFNLYPYAGNSIYVHGQRKK